MKIDAFSLGLIKLDVISMPDHMCSKFEVVQDCRYSNYSQKYFAFILVESK